MAGSCGFGGGVGVFFFWRLEIPAASSFFVNVGGRQRLAIVYFGSSCDAVARGGDKNACLM